MENSLHADELVGLYLGGDGGGANMHYAYKFFLYIMPFE